MSRCFKSNLSLVNIPNYKKFSLINCTIIKHIAFGKEDFTHQVIILVKMKEHPEVLRDSTGMERAVSRAIAKTLNTLYKRVQNFGTKDEMLWQ